MKHRFFIVLISLIFAAFSATVVMAALTDGLVAHWPFDDGSGDVAVDATGNGNDGELQGGPTWTGDSMMGTGSLTFDGTDDLVRLASFDVEGGNGITIACWIMATNLDTPGDDPRMVSKAVGGNNEDHWFMMSSSRVGADKVLRFRLKTDGVTGELKAGTDGIIDLDAWIHAVASWDGSTMRLYKNGAEVGSLAKGGVLDVDPTVEMAIGSQPATTDARPFDGSIDDVAIWNRALTPDEINELMTLGIDSASAVEPDSKLTTTWGSIKY
ncbi:LamG domain-containing protein [Candidatus Poribacteria bacterium]